MDGSSEGAFETDGIEVGGLDDDGNEEIEGSIDGSEDGFIDGVEVGSVDG